MAGALRNTKLSVEIHLMSNGGHGYGLCPGKPAAVTLPLLAENWLARILHQ